VAFGAGLAAVLSLSWLRACDPRREELSANRYAELAHFADLRTRAEVEAALALVDPDGRLRPFFTLTDGAIEVRVATSDLTAAVRVPLRAAPVTAIGWRPRRIALDPGHFGGAWSRTEKRHVQRDDEMGPPVREGDLSWATARLVERQLKAAGFEVRLVRGPPPASPYPTDLDAGFDAALEAAVRLGEQHGDDPPWRAPFSSLGLWRELRQLVRDRPFELYNHYELRRRAAMAESFAADLTLSLHYDFTQSDANGILVFMPGAFLGDELATASQRFWAFRRVLDGTLPIARQLANTVASAMMERLQLPALPASHDPETGSNWRAIAPERGVYARNLAILRRAPGVALLLEGPCVNERREYQRLSRTDLEIDGHRYPARVAEYADAVVEALRVR
jgi:N-acetylmuramoyl-L-alanine amidase